jgi:hypothetical protein
MKHSDQRADYFPTDEFKSIDHLALNYLTTRGV